MKGMLLFSVLTDSSIERHREWTYGSFSKGCKSFWLLPREKNAKENLYLRRADPQRSIYFTDFLVFELSCPCVGILNGKKITGWNKSKSKINNREKKEGSCEVLENGKNNVMTHRGRGEVEVRPVDDGRMQIDVRGITSWTAQNTIIHKGEMASVKGAWVRADLDFVWTTLCPPFVLLILHKLKCLFVPSKKTHKEAMKQWQTERVFLPALTGINQPATAQSCTRPDNSALRRAAWPVDCKHWT